MPIRLPFSRRNDQTAPTAVSGNDGTNTQTTGDAGSDTQGRLSAKSTSSVNILKSKKDPEDADTYQLQVVSGGIYLPPSPPPERQKFWRRSASTQSSQKAPTAEEPFVISRESFDSYRRSFDISARSPIPDFDNSRRSLDIRQGRPSFYTPPRTARASVSSESGSPREGFEDVSLNDENEPPRRRGLLSKVLGHGDAQQQPQQKENEAPRHLLPMPFHRKQQSTTTIHESELERFDKQRKADANANGTS